MSLQGGNMILYTNGDSHTAAAEAVVPHAFAEDDRRFPHLGRKPHPDNIRISWGAVLANLLKMTFHTDAESASSNARIIRTTKEWIENTKDTINPSDVFMIIQWSTWEREEWLIDGTYFQVNASGIDDVPEGHQLRYKEWITEIDWNDKTNEAFYDIIHFHHYLNELGYKHVFFNGNSTFFDLPEEKRYDFGEAYINPYLPEESYDGWLQANGYGFVITSNYHYGHDAHAAWARRMLKHIVDNKMV